MAEDSSATRPFLFKSDLQLAMAVKYWYTIQIGVLNNDLRFVVDSVKNIKPDSGPYFIDPCVPLVVFFYENLLCEIHSTHDYCGETSGYVVGYQILCSARP